MGRKRKHADENEAPVTGVTTVEKSLVAKGPQKSIKKPLKTVQKSAASSGSGDGGDRAFRRAKMWHKRKWSIIAPLVTKLMLEKRIEELRDECVNEFTIYHNPAEDNDTSRRDMTLGTATEDDRTTRDDDIQSVISRASYRDEWRTVHENDDSD